MSATAHIKSIEPALLEVLKTKPRLVEMFVCCYPPTLPPDLPDELRRQMESDPTVQSMLDDSRQWLRDDAPDTAEALINSASEPHLYLDKGWNALSASLADDELARRCIAGGQSIGPDLGYGPARYLTPAQVAEGSTALGSLATPRFSHPQLASLFAGLRSYYAESAMKGHAILIHLA